MAVLSVLRRFVTPAQNLSKFALQNGLGNQQVRNAGDRKMYIIGSYWDFNKFKDILHFYFMLGVIPLTTIVFLANIYVGPAQLAKIPEGYTPKHWEYEKHPVSRWFSKYVYKGFQEEYERMLHYMYEKNEEREMRLIEQHVQWCVKNKRGIRGIMEHRTPHKKALSKIRKDFEDKEEYFGIN